MYIYVHVIVVLYILISRSTMLTLCMYKFGKSLSVLRKKKELTQQHVAKKLGVTLDSYRQMEYRDRKPSLEAIIRILNILGATIEELFPELSGKVQSLTDNEKDLLKKYTLLNDQQQTAVLKLIESFL